MKMALIILCLVLAVVLGIRKLVGNFGGRADAPKVKPVPASEAGKGKPVASTSAAPLVQNDPRIIEEHYQHHSDYRRGAWHEGAPYLVTDARRYVQGQVCVYGMVVAISRPDLGQLYATVKCVQPTGVTYVVASTSLRSSVVSHVRSEVGSR
jgi:hypothetical protein